MNSVTRFLRNFVKKVNNHSSLFVHSVFRPYDKIAVIKTIWQWHKNRRIDQRDRIQHPEIKPHVHGHVIYGKGGKNIQWEKTASSINGPENWTATCKIIKTVVPLSHTIYKNET